MDAEWLNDQVLKVKLLCVGFIVCVFVILLNMLIAIMNDSYSTVTTEFDQGMHSIYSMYM